MRRALMFLIVFAVLFSFVTVPTSKVNADCGWTGTRTHWWGYTIYLSHGTLDAIYDGDGLAGVFSGLLTQDPRVGAVVGIASYALVRRLKSVDRGCGVYIDVNVWKAGALGPGYYAAAVWNVKPQ